jgi:hypothetical protein
MNCMTVWKHLYRKSLNTCINHSENNFETIVVDKMETYGVCTVRFVYTPYGFFLYSWTKGLSTLELLLYEYFSQHEILTSVAMVGIEIWTF